MPLDSADIAKLDLLLTDEDKRVLAWRQAFLEQARPNQTPPPGDWLVWGIMAGRGFGKTYAGANWTAYESLMEPKTISHVIAPTWSDAQFVCMEGPAGLVNIIPPELVRDYNRSDLIITLTNGSIIRAFTAEKPDRLRGPQCHRIWADELAAWQRAQETWDMAMMGLRLGQQTRAVFTTTPKPVPLVQALVKDKNVAITRGTTYENKANLAPTFFQQLAKYEGTQLGRQELMGELIDPEESGIIKRSWFKLWPADKKLPAFDFVVMSLDTAFTEQTRDKKSGNADPTACAVWGFFKNPNTKRSEMMLLDCWQEWLGLPDLIEKVRKELKVEYGDVAVPMIKPLYGAPLVGGTGKKIDLIIIEDKGSGISLRQMLEREGVVTYPYNPGRADKLARLHIVSHIPANGYVWLPESKKRAGEPMTWTEPLLGQLCVFTGEGSTEHDDFVDVCSQAWRYFADKGSMVFTGYKRDPDVVLPPKKSSGNPYAA